MIVERISIELSGRCSKGCGFCYNASGLDVGTRWTADTVIAFALDCAQHGTRAVSFGGGEPLEAPELLWPALAGLAGVVFRSFTTNGLLLDAELDRVIAARPDKVHVSIHAPGDRREVERVIRQVGALADAGITTGINFLVARSQLPAAAAAAAAVHAAGIGNERIVFLPMRGDDTPTPAQVAAVAGPRFQSMTCLTACARSPRFAAIGWDQAASWCSYTRARRSLPTLDHDGLVRALTGLDLLFCGEPAPISIRSSRDRSPRAPARTAGARPG